MEKNFIQKFGGYIAAIALFLVLSMVFFYPVVLENKALEQGDIKSSKGWGQDAREYHQKTGDYVYWSNMMFSGMPANYTYMPASPNIFTSLSKIAVLNNGGSWGLLFLYMLGFYILLMALGCKNWLSVIGAIAYAFCSYNLIIIDAGHILKGVVMATIAPTVAGIILCYRGKYVLGAFLTLLFTGLNIFWGHQQISYYLLLIIVILFIVYLIYAIKNKTVPAFAKSSVILLVAGLLAVTPSLGKLLPTMDYTKETMRGGAVLKANADGQKESSGLDLNYAYQWSYGKMESFTLLIPNFAGASSAYNLGEKSETYKSLLQTGQAAQFVKQAPMYWADNEFKTFTSGPVYAGAIICFLFVLGLFVVKGREKWWILAATILSLILAWGRNLYGINEFLFHHLPIYNKFRTPEMALVIANFTMALLAVLAIKEIIENYKTNSKEYLKSIYISAGITGGLCLLFALFGGMMFDFTSNVDKNFPDWLQNALITDRKSMLTGDSWRSILFIILGAGILIFWLKKWFKPNYLFLILGILIFIDLWSVDRRFIYEEKFLPKQQALDIMPTAVDNMILQDKDPNYRVLNLASNTFNESMTSYFHKSVGGYSPAKLRRYQDIIDYYFSKQINPNIINMLNTKYVIVNTKQGAIPQLNPNAFGNAWFVDSIKWVNSPDEEIVEIGNVNLKNTAVIDKNWENKMQKFPKTNIACDTVNSIKLTKYASPGHLIYEYFSCDNNFAVFSEVYYKTWKAYIDGKEAPIIRVNYILRGLQIPAGNHKIEFKCLDELIIKSRTYSLIGSIAVGAVLISLLGLLIFKVIKK